MTDTPLDQAAVEQFAQRVVAAVLGAQEVHAMYLGDRLGYYRTLASGGPATAPELARRAGADARYTREWLEHQAVSGYVTVDDVGADADERRFELPAAHVEVLTAGLSLSYCLPLARLTAALGRQVGELVDAYRTGEGVAWAQFGDDGRQAQADANRPMFLGPLTTEYLPGIPEVHAALGDGGRVADIGCGGGWSSIGIALGYPQSTVDGFDLDGPSVDLARANAAAAGVGDRARFFHADAGTAAGTGDGYDLVCAFECIHDMPDPVSVLATMRSLAAPGATVLVMDERVAESFTAPGDEVERLMYGYSITCCLPDGRSHTPSVATGTVMRPSTLEGYARQAGFAGLEILPLENDFFRFYRLHG